MCRKIGQDRRERQSAFDLFATLAQKRDIDGTAKAIAKDALDDFRGFAALACRNEIDDAVSGQVIRPEASPGREGFIDRFHPSARIELDRRSARVEPHRLLERLAVFEALLEHVLFGDVAKERSRANRNRKHGYQKVAPIWGATIACPHRRAA